MEMLQLLLSAPLNYSNVPKNEWTLMTKFTMIKKNNEYVIEKQHNTGMTRTPTPRIKYTLFQCACWHEIEMLHLKLVYGIMYACMAWQQGPKIDQHSIYFRFCSSMRQLEETEDFDERREIRQKLRELRKKRLAAVETGTPTITDRERRREERRRQREQGNEENNGPTETRREEKTTTIDVVSSGETENNAAVKSFQLSVSTTQTTVVENGAVNGSAEEKESEDREDVEVSAENEMEDEPGQVETEQCDTEVDTVEQPTEGSADDKSAKKEEENGACKDETEGNTTLETLMVIEEIEDLDNLEKLVRSTTFLTFFPFPRTCFH